MIWIVLFIALLLQSSSTAPWGVSLLFALCFTACAIAVSTCTSRKITPEILAVQKLKPLIYISICGVLFLAFLLALLVELFYYLESEGFFYTSSFMFGVRVPFVIVFLGMLPTSVTVIIGFCGFEQFRIYSIREKERLEDRLNFLKNRANPRFTFNVLSHIHILMRISVGMADELLLRFSDVLRYRLYECNNNIVLLESELKNIRDVVEIERMRWGDELKVNVIFEVKDSATIPPLILIPFIENAFRHASHLPGRKGYVNIYISQTGKSVRLTVENSKSPESPCKSGSSGVGLSDVRKRLDISYPEKYCLDIRETDGIYKTDLQITLE